MRHCDCPNRPFGVRRRETNPPIRPHEWMPAFGDIERIVVQHHIGFNFPTRLQISRDLPAAIFAAMLRAVALRASHNLKLRRDAMRAQQVAQAGEGHEGGRFGIAVHGQIAPGAGEDDGRAGLVDQMVEMGDAFGPEGAALGVFIECPVVQHAVDVEKY